jgi:hypothetical protein
VKNKCWISDLNRILVLQRTLTFFILSISAEGWYDVDHYKIIMLPNCTSNSKNRATILN